MLVVGEALRDAAIRDFPAFLRPGDVVIFNDTRVIPARLWGKRGEAGIEVTLLSGFRIRDSGSRIWAFAKPGKRCRVGEVIRFGEDFTATILEKKPSGEVLLDFGVPSEMFHQRLRHYGAMPLPPYIRRAKGENLAEDVERYQTVYATREGAVAAPTAGLHFTPELLAAIDRAGAKRVTVTLHVGAGTFLPVKAEDTGDHVMHAERGVLTQEAAAAINEARREGARVIAIGTTSLRLLESAADEAGVLHPFDGETRIFITPGYRFKAVDVLLTNFHLPRSTLFMLTCAFSGLERMQTAYAHAIAQGYRFYSYGDACLLFRR